MGSDTNTTTLGIADLRDIVLPDPVPWWPPAPGAWVVLAVVMVTLAILVWHAIRRHHRNAYRRVGLAECASLEARLPDRAALSELSVLLKRVALAAYPREQVAAMYGSAWLHFLDMTCPGCRFAEGPGHLLFQGLAESRQSLAPEGKDLEELVHQCRRWIRFHTPHLTPDT